MFSQGISSGFYRHLIPEIHSSVLNEVIMFIVITDLLLCDNHNNNNYSKLNYFVLTETKCDN